ncbi:MAG: hypothetical protein J0L97_05070 [Alphaproteobacteria bacterium]|nr:hypothetical protein [Alphaproteobacteria bacterium]
MPVTSYKGIRFQGVEPGQEEDFLRSIMTPGSGIYQDLNLTLATMFPESSPAIG